MKKTHVEIAVTVVCIIALLVTIHFFGNNIIPFIKKMHGM